MLNTIEPYLSIPFRTREWWPHMAIDYSRSHLEASDSTSC